MSSLPALYTAALIGFPSVLAPGTVFDTAVSRVEEITIGVLCAAVVHSLIFPKSALSAFEQKLRRAIADARLWIAEGLTKALTRQLEMERRRIAVAITELYTLRSPRRRVPAQSGGFRATLRHDEAYFISLPTLLSVCLTYQWPHCESNPSIRTRVLRYAIRERQFRLSKYNTNHSVGVDQIYGQRTRIRL